MHGLMLDVVQISALSALRRTAKSVRPIKRQKEKFTTEDTEKNLCSRHSVLLCVLCGNPSFPALFADNVANSTGGGSSAGGAIYAGGGNSNLFSLAA